MYLQDIRLNNFVPRRPILDSLIPANHSCRIRRLVVTPDQSKISTSFFESRGTIEPLEEFVWPSQGPVSGKFPPSAGGLAFLRVNAHITKFRVSYLVDAELLDQQIVPLLSLHFKWLKSLSLHWASGNISVINTIYQSNYYFGTASFVRRALASVASRLAARSRPYKVNFTKFEQQWVGVLSTSYTQCSIFWQNQGLWMAITHYGVAATFRRFIRARMIWFGMKMTRLLSSDWCSLGKRW
jgi:hypothetical protein